MSTDDHSSDGRDGDKLLVGEFALGLLDAAEHERMARRIAEEPALRAELRLWRTRLSGLDREFAESAAPARVLDRVEARLFGPAAPRGLGAFWNSLALWRGVAAGALAIAAIAVGVNLMRPQQLDPREFATQLVAALQSQEGSGVEFVALYDAATGSVRLTALSGEVAADKDLELWYIRGDDPAVSMGVVPVDRKVDVKLPPKVAPGFGAGTTLAVTLEQKGGSPTGVAQGPIVAVGKATLI